VVVLLHPWMAAPGSLVGSLASGGHVVLGPCLQGAWRRLAAPASWHVVVPVTGRASTADWTSTI
jgi:hypothetical protein